MYANKCMDRTGWVKKRCTHSSSSGATLAATILSSCRTILRFCEGNSQPLAFLGSLPLPSFLHMIYLLCVGTGHSRMYKLAVRYFSYAYPLSIKLCTTLSIFHDLSHFASFFHSLCTGCISLHSSLPSSYSLSSFPLLSVLIIN